MGMRIAALSAVLPSFYRSVGVVLPPATSDIAFPQETGRSFFSDLADAQTPPLLDAIAVDLVSTDLSEWLGNLRRIRLRLQRHGALYVFLSTDGHAVESILTAMEPLGLGYYQGWRWEIADPRPIPLSAPFEASRGDLLLRFQRFAYDPVAHARDHLREMGFGYALAVLNEVPEHWYTSDEARGLHEAERLVALLAQDRHAGPALRMLHLVSALHAYNRACTFAPLHEASYQCMAAFWRGVGRPDMARRLLTTVETILPTPAGTESLRRLDGEACAPVRYDYPPYDPKRPLRVLFLSHPESDFGADVLFDGLRRVLGVAHVIGYPWKATLHGQNPEEAFGYPCTFDWPDGPVELLELERELDQGSFDAILHCDAHGTFPREDLRRLLEAAGDTPVFILDTWDECGALQDILRERDGLRNVAGYFKREMVQGLDYGPNAWPLPFAYPDGRFPEMMGDPARTGVFWAGKLIGGARRLQLSWLTPQVPITGGWGTQYSQEEYVALLRTQSVGLCFFGNGFDTVRYWELPAHGAMLLAERSPLVLPNNFEDGIHAVFFDHAADLLDKIRHYLAHPEEASAIAAAGHEHALKYHTGSARARQCLGVIQTRLANLGLGRRT